MCFGFGGGTRLVTRTSHTDRNRVYEEHVVPGHHRPSRRRFGMSYYPERYYARPPCGRYAGALTYAPHYVQQGVYPRGIAYNRGGYFAGGHALMPTRTAVGTYYHGGPTYAYTPAAAQAYVYPPGAATTTTTTYHVTNSHARPVTVAPPAPIRHTTTTYPCRHQGPTREDIQMENRRVATQRGAYNARRIKPADARDDDPFWCRERNGEWHLRTYYQIENECYPGRWLMDAEMGFLVFHRD